MNSRFFFNSLVVVLTFMLGPVRAVAADLVFGQVAFLSNPASASNARGLGAGISAYFETVNAKGGIHGHKLKLRNKDDLVNTQTMLDLTQEFVNDPSVIGLISYLNTAGISALARKNLFAKEGIAFIAPLQGDRDVVETESVFPLRSGYVQEVETILLEAKGWGKNSIAIVNMDIAFGPIVGELAESRAKELGFTVAPRQVIRFDSKVLESSVATAVQAISAHQPKAVLLLATGRPASEFIKALRNVPAGNTQIYGVSVLLHQELVKAVGAASARGIVLSQAIPYPFSSSRPVITEYQTAMTAYMPQAQRLNCCSFEF